MRWRSKWQRCAGTSNYGKADDLILSQLCSSCRCHSFVSLHQALDALTSPIPSSSSTCSPRRILLFLLPLHLFFSPQRALPFLHPRLHLLHQRALTDKSSHSCCHSSFSFLDMLSYSCHHSPLPPQHARSLTPSS